MKRILLIGIVLALVTSGCRVTDTTYECELPAAGSTPNELSETLAGDDADRSPSGQQTEFRQLVQELPETQPDASELPRAIDEPPEPWSLEPIARTSEAPTLEDLEKLALANNPTLREARARVEQAQGRWLQVGLKPNPRIGYVAEEVGDNGTLGKQGGFIGQQFIRGGKLELNRAIAEQEIARAEQEVAAQQFRVLTDVRLAYYDFLIAVRRSDLAGTLLQYAKKAEEDTQKLLEGGEAKRSDLLRTQIEVRSIEVVRRDAEFQKRSAWKTLSAVLADPGLEMPEVNEALKTAARKQLDQAAHRGIDHQQELDRIMSSSPEIAAAMAGVEAARWSVDRAYAEVVPDVDARVALLGNAVNGDTLVGVQMSLPLPIWNRNQGGVREAQAQVMEAERSVDRVALSLIQRFQVAYQRYLNAKYQVDQYTKTGETDEDQGILAKAQESIELNQRLHRAGEIKNLEMILAQQVYTQANLSYLDAVRELWASILEIEGLLLKDSLK